ncbi:hypothetical protein MAPG_01048 [Magnaporthiopsis poae ATCC 64411]|uniref:Uncharacterized protein n=1 Tax=Magnaporthiopsis poae (strain ATCC 64411 / 73-15) TaxID=644358 RepID=A0A0C4DMN7_MAGP6|nr:hypothetical protein MAPG_01048 [Magnaporthiopsis poae ATCC 64411]
MRPANALLLLLTTSASASGAVDIQARQTGGGHNCKCRGYPTPGIFCGNCVYVSNGSYLISEGRFDTHALVVWGGAEIRALSRPTSPIQILSRTRLSTCSERTGIVSAGRGKLGPGSSYGSGDGCRLAGGSWV